MSARRNRSHSPRRRTPPRSSISSSSLSSAGSASPLPRSEKAAAGRTIILLLAFASMALAMALVAMRGRFLRVALLLLRLALSDRPRGWRRSVGANGSPQGPSTRSACSLSSRCAALFWSALGASVKASPAAEGPTLASCGVRADMASLAAEPQGSCSRRSGSGRASSSPPATTSSPRPTTATIGQSLRARDADRFTRAAHTAIKERGVGYVALCLGDPDLPISPPIGRTRCFRRLSLASAVLARAASAARADPRLARRRLTRLRAAVRRATIPMARILFEFGDLKLEAETLETPTAAAILAALPLDHGADLGRRGLFRHRRLDAARDECARRRGGRRDRLLAGRRGDRDRLRPHADLPQVKKSVSPAPATSGQRRSATCGL